MLRRIVRNILFPLIAAASALTGTAHAEPAVRVGTLQFGGVLVLIVPHYVLDEDFSAAIARNFERVRVFMAPEQKFKQCVIFGVKRHANTPNPTISGQLEAVGRCGAGGGVRGGRR